MDTVLKVNQEEIELMYSISRRTNIYRPNVKEYRKIRKEYETMMTKIVDYFYENSDALLARLDRELKQLSRSHGFNLKADMQIYHEFSAYISLMIYPFFTGCICDMMLKKRKVRSEKNIELMKNIRNSRFRLCKIIARDYKTCTIVVEDMLTKQQITAMDERMSFDAEIGAFITARFLSMDGITFRIGPCFAFFEDDADILDWIAHQQQEKIEAFAFIELYNLYQYKWNRKQAYQIKLEDSI